MIEVVVSPKQYQAYQDARVNSFAAGDSEEVSLEKNAHLLGIDVETARGPHKIVVDWEKKDD